MPLNPIRPTLKLTKDDREFRELALCSFPMFCESFNVSFEYRAALVHRVICAVVELVEQRLVKRVCISLPPRTGKSETSTVLAPAWMLSRNPKLNVIQGGYSADLSTQFSVKTKNLFRSKRYRYFMGDMLAPGQNRQDEWGTHEGGHYLATSVGGAATGFGADALLVDDCLNGRKDARSAAKRLIVWDWFMSVMMKRLSPNGVALVIGTRWHKDDLIGRLTSEENNRKLRDAGLADKQWYEVNIQAVCEDVEKDLLGRAYGESYWPEQWSLAALKEIELQSSSEWAAQYQGKPRPDNASECDVGKIEIIDRADVPEGLTLYRAWDLALGEKQTSDWSAGAYGGIDSKTGIMYLIHLDRRKRRWLEQKQAILNYAERESIGGRIAVEGVSAWKVAIEELQKAAAGRFMVKAYTPTTDKVARATPWTALVDAGKFKIVRGPWNQDFLTELEDFPTGEHDDQIDSVSILHACAARKGDFHVA